MSDPEHLPGRGLDRCICVHAEQNALLQAARFGVRIEGSTLYSTLSPCFGCLKEAIQAGVRRVRLRPRVPGRAARPDRRPVPRARRAPLPRRSGRLRAAQPVRLDVNRACVSRPPGRCRARPGRAGQAGRLVKRPGREALRRAVPAPGRARRGARAADTTLTEPRHARGDSTSRLQPAASRATISAAGSTSWIASTLWPA